MPDYDFYCNYYYGTAIPPDEWAYYKDRAAEQLEQYKRLHTVTAPGPDSEARAVCAMAETLYGFDLLSSGEGGPVQSASIGSVSVSYGGTQSADLSDKARANALYRAACRYLDIYRGVR